MELTRRDKPFSFPEINARLAYSKPLVQFLHGARFEGNAPFWHRKVRKLRRR